MEISKSLIMSVIVQTLIIQAFCLGIWFFAPCDNHIGLWFEGCQVAAFAGLIHLFHKCPKCGKHTLAKHYNQGSCRNCKCKIEI